MNIKAQFDAAATLRALERSPQTTIEHIRRALLESCKLVQSGAREKHRFKARNGKLERAIEFNVDISKCEGEVYIDSSIAPYGVFVHEPTGTYAPPNKRLPSKFYRWSDGSYAIRPVNKKYLRFAGVNGKFIFAKQVRHPGSPADRFLYESADRNRAKINTIFVRHTSQAQKEAGL